MIVHSYEEQVCHQPKLDINNTEVLKFLKNVPPLECDKEEDWVEIDGSTVRITAEAKKKYGDIICQFTGNISLVSKCGFVNTVSISLFFTFSDVVRSSDFGTFLGHVVKTHSEFDLEESDFFRANCKSESGKE